MLHRPSDSLSNPQKKKKALLSVGGCNVDISPLSLHRSLGVTHEQTALLKWPFLKKIP